MFCKASSTQNSVRCRCIDTHVCSVQSVYSVSESSVCLHDELAIKELMTAADLRRRKCWCGGCCGYARVCRWGERGLQPEARNAQDIILVPNQGSAADQSIHVPHTHHIVTPATEKKATHRAQSQHTASMAPQHPAQASRCGDQQPQLHVYPAA